MTKRRRCDQKYRSCGVVNTKHKSYFIYYLQIDSNDVVFLMITQTASCFTFHRVGMMMCDVHPTPQLIRGLNS